MASTKIRIYELSKTLGKSNKDVLALVEKELGISLKSHSSSLDKEQADQIIAKFTGGSSSSASSAMPKEKSPASMSKPAVASEKKMVEKKPESTKASVKPVESSPAPAPVSKKVPSPTAVTKPSVKKSSDVSSSDATALPSTSKPVSGGSRSEQKPVPLTPKGKPGNGGRSQGPRENTTTAPAPQPQKSNVAQLEPKLQPGRSQGKMSPEVEEEAEPLSVKVTRSMTVRELSELLNLRETEIIKQLFMKGVMVTVNQTLDVDYAQAIVKQLGFLIEEEEEVEDDYTASRALEKKEKLDTAKYKNLQGRAPVVSIMGHVDHGKTSLLDAIRETRHNIVDGEAGGITQSIGAYSVEKDGQKVVFLDTPGHEAFTAMRMRGAKATDIAILVVAADDGVMPQTVEAINHAKAAEIPMIIAVNKIDKEGADPDKVLSQLSDIGLVSEKWGGETVTVEVSALEKLGIDDLLEMIVLVSELLELKADPTVPGEGVIIEAQLDKRKGPAVTALVQNGTIRIGDNLIIGSVGGRVRALINDSGERVTEAGPSTPVEILGLDAVPKAGDPFEVMTDDKEYKQALQSEKLKVREERLMSRTRLQGMMGSVDKADGEQEKIQQKFNVIVKADTQGSAEAVNGALVGLGTDVIQLSILHSGTGEISEADVMLASASDAVIVGFNVRTDPNAQRVAEQNRIQIHSFEVIYHITEMVKELMLGQLAPEIMEVECGRAEIREVFNLGKNRIIAGCFVTEGKAIRNAKVRLFRDDVEIYYGSLDTLRRFKDDVKEVASGYECGMSFYKFPDFKVGDTVIIYTTEKKAPVSLS